MKNYKRETGRYYAFDDYDGNYFWNSNNNQYDIDYDNDSFKTHTHNKTTDKKRSNIKQT